MKHILISFPRKAVIQYFLLLLTCIVCGQSLLAISPEREEIYYGGIYHHDITPSAAFTVAAPLNPQANIVSSKDVVWFSIDEEFKLKTVPFTASLDVIIEKYSPDGSALWESEHVTFTVNFDPNGGISYNQSDVFEFTGYSYIKIIVQSPGIVTSPSLPELADAFKLESRVIVTQYPLNYTISTSPSILPHSIDDNKNTLLAAWTTVEGADEYDVEWTFYDTLSCVYPGQGATFSAQFNQAFINNATRVSTAQNNYPISLVYPAGRLYIRVRAVAYLPGGIKVTTPWHSEVAGFAPSFSKDIYRLPDSRWHEKNINWQMKAVYAEEGKKSQNVDYYDGMLKGRQSVAKSDASNVIIASETIYDRQGRPTIQVMPAPVSIFNFDDPATPEYPWTQKIQFNRSFSAAPGLDYYTADQFEGAEEEPGLCGPIGNPASIMDTSRSIAARYYSSNNPWRNKMFHNNIPSADGYPFAVTEYTPDATGRLRRQGSVGAHFQLGTFHDTRYYYSKPTQEELDRLFGVEAGYAEHYQKITVIDPNGAQDEGDKTATQFQPGQASVSYVDIHGRTVATSLVGEAPVGLFELDNFEKANAVTKNILNNVADETALKSTYTLIITRRNAQGDFFYELVGDEANFKECLKDDYCADCLYDLEIGISDECGNEIGHSILSNFNIKDFRDQYLNQGLEGFLKCEAVPELLQNAIHVENLAIGEYKVTKTLKVSQEALGIYTQDYLSKLTCLPDLLTLTYEFLGDTTCYQTCEECFKAVGSLEEFQSDFFSEQSGTPSQAELDYVKELYDEAIANCSNLCDNSEVTTCGLMYQSMLIDVTPGGQYALYETTTVDDEDIYSGSTDVTSLFNLTLLQYQNPNLVYYDETGKKDTIFFNEITGPKIPNQLTVNEFIRYFKPSWTETLVQLHPEYCNYLCCLQTQEKSIDSVLQTIHTISEAAALGYWPPEALLGADPFYNNPDNAQYLLEITEFINNYTASDTSDCSRTFSLIEAIQSAVCCQGELPCTQTCCETDMNWVWEIFLNQYLSYKNYQKSVKIRGGACGKLDNVPTFITCPVSPSLCIGEPMCDGIPNPYADKVSTIPAYYDYSQLTPEEATDQIEAMLEDFYDEIDSNCDDVCQGHAQNWITTLQHNCPEAASASPAQIQSLTTEFALICANGCDLQHPFGGSEAQFYEQIQAKINSALFGGASPALCASPGCQAELLNYPGIPDAPAYLTPPMTLTGSTETCDYCTQMAKKYDCWLSIKAPSIPADPAHFVEYLNSLSNVTFTLEDYNNICPTEGCTYTVAPVTVHPLLECDVCKDYDVVKSTWEQVYVNCPSVSPEWERMVAARMNARLGLNRSFQEYLSFINQNTGLPNPKCRFLCPKAMFEAVPPVVSPCFTPQEWESALILANAHVNNLKEEFRQKFIDNYLNKCLGNIKETFTFTSDENEYQYTLYYYDQAGNLVKTIPPKGVAPITDPSILQQIKDHRIAGESSFVSSDYPKHTLPTRYFYNSLGEMVQSKMPDHDGTGTYQWMDALGRPVLTQNALQRTQNRFAYVLYDRLSRIVETGEAQSDAVPYFANDLSKVWNIANSEELTNWVMATAIRFEVIHTWYDATIPGFTPYCPQENLRNRIASVTIQPIAEADPLSYASATHYSYDIAGNVKCLVQEFPGLSQYNRRFFRIDYDYDLVSGKVNYVYYQKDQADQFIHRYVYDADNRLQYVETSTDGLIWAREANYEYYLHGPLARTELGDYRVQGEDFAYTLQGWLKGVNASTLALDSKAPVTADFTTRDIGRDGKVGKIGEWNRNRSVARDAFGFTLGYYNRYFADEDRTEKDFRRIGSMPDDVQLDFELGLHGSVVQQGIDLYNGNITHALYSIANLNNHDGLNYPDAFSYGYDQLHRIKESSTFTMKDYYNLESFRMDPSGTSYGANFSENFRYDPNGNILNAGRADYSGQMDELTYNYPTPTLNNRLSSVSDQVQTPNNNQDLENQAANNYQYNPIGNLVGDLSENNGTYDWTYDQKLKSVVSYTGVGALTQSDYYYNPMRQRIVKDVLTLGHQLQFTDFYVRDAQGNIMAVYSKNIRENTPFRLKEHHLYGSSRLGIRQQYIDLEADPSKPVPNPNDPATPSHTPLPLGTKRYELANHLGNVLAVVSDRKHARAESINSGEEIQWYEADILSSQQYYAFGMLMPRVDGDPVATRQYNVKGFDYRFGFNGKEGDDEVKGDDNQQDYGMRIYDPRVGRFLSVDPITSQYPWYTPYQFAGNKPIWAVDLDGLEEDIVTPSTKYFKSNNTVQLIDKQTGKDGKFLDADDINFIHTTVGHYIINDAFNKRKASTSGGLIVLALASIESSWGRKNGTTEYNNYFSLLKSNKKSGRSQLGTDHGDVIKYKSLEEGVSAFYKTIELKYSGFGDVIQQNSISSDDINKVFGQGKYFGKSQCYRCGDAGSEDVGDEIIDRAILIQRYFIGNAYDKIRDINTSLSDLNKSTDTTGVKVKTEQLNTELSNWTSWKNKLESIKFTKSPDGP